MRSPTGGSTTTSRSSRSPAPPSGAPPVLRTSPASAPPRRCRAWTTAMPDPHLRLVSRLYECFNYRDESCLSELCDEAMEFYPAMTAEAIGREAPYSGSAGLHDYLTDVAQIWEELQVSPSEIEARGELLLVHGRTSVSYTH